MPVDLGVRRRETRSIRCEQADGQTDRQTDGQCYFIDIDTGRVDSGSPCTKKNVFPP